jgi:MEMO1 family protein
VAVRAPAVAGRFYPGEPEVLAAQVDAMLAAVEVPAGDRLAAAYVVPHAGHRFSGGTAAHVYSRLRAHAADIARVVLIGPAHYVRLSGCAVPTVDRWATPLGEIALDTAGRDALVAAGHAAGNDEPHAPEHSLEVQLPFLQRVLPDGVPILPVAAGPSTTDSVADLLAAARADGTVLLCSTDLSHYHDDATARELDRATIDTVLARDAERIAPRSACGLFALRGLTALAARLDWTPTLLDYTTSADTAGAPERVVGYAAFAVA